MKGICPNCEKETTIDRIRTKEPIEVRGEPIEVETEFSKCVECGEEFENTRGHDALEIAYREYRARHGMLQPEQVRDWRKNIGLTQKELSALLGWGGATLSRYENGALQDEAHEKILRLAMDPRNLLTLLRETPTALSDEKRDRLMAELAAAQAESCSFERIFEERFGGYAPDEYSGYRKLDPNKLLNVILFLCRGGTLKTKLNKLLFYADFKHFKEYTVSLTGARYVHLQYGPVPSNYEFYFAELVNEGKLEIEEMQVAQYFGENCVTRREPDIGMFLDSELKILAEVKDYFKNFNSSQIKDFSHKERGYAETAGGQTISYRFAEHLQI